MTPTATTDRDAEVQATLDDVAAAVEQAQRVASELRQATKAMREDRRNG